MRRKMFEEFFERGINTVDDPYSIKDGYVRELDNLIPSIGSPVPRKGHKLIEDKYKIMQDVFGAVEVVINQSNALIQMIKGGSSTYYYWSNSPTHLEQIVDFNDVPISNHTDIKFFNIGSSVGFTSVNGVFLLEIVGGVLKARKSYKDSSSLFVWYPTSNPSISDDSLKSNHNTIYPHNRKGSINYKDSSKRIEVIANQDNLLVWGYLVTMVRHPTNTDSVISSYIPGVMETSSLYEKDIRHYVTYPEPISTLDPSKSFYESVNGMADGSLFKYAIDSRTRQLYSNIASTSSTKLEEANVVAPTWIKTNFKHYNINDAPNTRIYLPQHGLTEQEELDELSNGIVAFDQTRNNNYYNSIGKEFTHFRIYRTLVQSNINAVDGAEFYHLVDVKIDPTTHYYDDFTTDTELTGSLGRYYFFGTKELPGTSSSQYEYGSLWCLDPFLSSNCIYSMRPQEFNADEKWIGHFRLDTDWFQVAPHSVKHISRIGDDIYVMTDRSIYYIPKGQPSISPPILLTNEAGVKLVGSIQKIRNGLYFVSTSGPAIIRSGRFEIIESFRDSKVYPRFGINTSNRKESKSLDSVTDIWSTVINGIWVLQLSYSGTKEFLCYIEEPEQGYVGAFTMSSQDSWIDQGSVVVDSTDGYMVAIYNNTPYLIQLMATDAIKDVYNKIKIKIRTKAQWVYPEQKDFQGEAFNLKIIASGKDPSPYLLKVYAEENLVASNEAWYRWYIDGRSNEANHAISEYSFQDGVIGTNYAFYIEKTLTSEWYLNGITFTFIPRKRKIGVSGSTTFADLTPIGVGFDAIQGIDNKLPVY